MNWNKRDKRRTRQECRSSIRSTLVFLILRH
jgi:hypothetical protein